MFAYQQDGYQLKLIKIKTEIIDKVFLDDITAIYINHLRDHILFKMTKLPNIWLKSKHAESIIRIVYSLKMNSELPIFDISKFNLNEYIYNDSFPSSDLLYLIGRESCNIVLSESSINKIYPSPSKVDIKTLDT